jgi:hypothetical protein
VKCDDPHSVHISVSIIIYIYDKLIGPAALPHMDRQTFGSSYRFIASKFVCTQSHRINTYCSTRKSDLMDTSNPLQAVVLYRTYLRQNVLVIKYLPYNTTYLFPFIFYHPIKIEHNHGEAVRRVQRHGFCDLYKTLPVALPRWGDRWMGRRILFYFVNWLRNNTCSACTLHLALIPNHLSSIEAARFLLIVAFFTMFCSRLRP